MKKLQRMVAILFDLRNEQAVATPELRQAADDLERYIAKQLNKLMEIH